MQADPDDLTAPILDRPLTVEPTGGGRHHLREEPSAALEQSPTGHVAWTVLVGFGCFLVVAMLLITVLWN
ncbi:hypothetical protein AD006_29550 (plasmid) [Pseudonocardia sp. EC080610-09]|nr:hypothetical protein AD006_29550 [Pseudonocardia sp. EC080610-09]ALL85633.1 hypothetical protein AD017_31700 [Pseudonocardia sp. EC080619-01]